MDTETYCIQVVMLLKILTYQSYGALRVVSVKIVDHMVHIFSAVQYAIGLGPSLSWTNGLLRWWSTEGRRHWIHIIKYDESSANSNSCVYM